MPGDLSIKDINVLTGKLQAIYNKLVDEEYGAISQLQTIMEKIDPVVINFTAKKEQEALTKVFNEIESLVKLQQSEIESITVKYFNDSKKLAETIIGTSVNEVIKAIDERKNEVLKDIGKNDLNDSLKLNYIYLVSSTSIGVIIGFILGAMI